MHSITQTTSSRSLALIAALCITTVAHAAQLRVSVKDNRGQPITDVVVVATPVGAPSGKSEPVSASIDQVDKRFVPEVLVVRVGTSVSFPNSDSIAHQVYSFSPAKRFTLPLYRGKVHPPLVFDLPGVVVLGCNIHDQMVGYVYVTSSPYFGKTDDNGEWISALQSGVYRVTAWHPRLDEALAEQEIKISDAEVQVLFQTRRALRPRSKSTDKPIRDY